MAESRARDNWAHTSSMLAMLANANRDRKKKPMPFKPVDFSPYEAKQKSGVQMNARNIGLLKSVFVDRRTQRGDNNSA